MEAGLDAEEIVCWSLHRKDKPGGKTRMEDEMLQLHQTIPAPPHRSKVPGPEPTRVLDSLPAKVQDIFAGASEEPTWVKDKTGVKRLELPAIARVVPRAAMYTFFRRHGDTYRAARRYWKVTDEPGTLQVIPVSYTHLTLPTKA